MTAAMTFHASRRGLGAAVLVALYLALLSGFVAVTSHAPSSTVIYVSGP